MDKVINRVLENYQKQQEAKKDKIQNDLRMILALDVKELEQLQFEQFQSFDKEKQFMIIEGLIIIGDVKYLINEIVLESHYFYEQIQILCDTYKINDKIVFMNEEGYGYGQIYYIIEFKNYLGREAYIHLRLFQDSQSLNFITNNISDYAGKDANKELIAIDKFLLIPIKDIVGLVCIYTSLDFQILSDQQKNSPYNFFMRLCYSYQHDRFDWIEDTESIQCQYCQEFLNPLQRTLICSCLATFIHLDKQDCNEHVFEKQKDNIILFRCDECKIQNNSIQQDHKGQHKGNLGQQKQQKQQKQQLATDFSGLKIKVYSDNDEQSNQNVPADENQNKHEVSEDDDKDRFLQQLCGLKAKNKNNGTKKPKNKDKLIKKQTKK